MQKKAFTLAEVLITLMVIGILAVITIPSILQSWKERVTVTKLKQTYAILQQAFKMAEIENGAPDTWCTPSNDCSSKTIPDKLVPYLPVLIDCGATNVGDSCVSSKYITFNDQDFTAIPYGKQRKVLLKNGATVIGGVVAGGAWNGYAAVDGYPAGSIIYVDINGPQPPNQVAIDTFPFALTKKGIMPFGGANLPDRPNYFYHSLNGHGCKIGWNGVACTRWVIERGNMDYIHKTTTW